MKSAVFKKMLLSAVSKWNLDPKKTFMLVRWWDDSSLHAVTMIDGNSYDGKCYLISTEECVQSGKYVGPSNFYIWNGAVRANQVVHVTMTLDKVMNSHMIDEYDSIDVLISRSPVNSIIGINPFQTKAMKGVDGIDCLVIQIDGRDSGEFQPDESFKGEESLPYIKEFDLNAKTSEKKVCFEDSVDYGNGENNQSERSN